MHSADVPEPDLPLWDQYTNCAISWGSNHCFQAIRTYRNSRMGNGLSPDHRLDNNCFCAVLTPMPCTNINLIIPTAWMCSIAESAMCALQIHRKCTPHCTFSQWSNVSAIKTLTSSRSCRVKCLYQSPHYQSPLLWFAIIVSWYVWWTRTYSSISSNLLVMSVNRWNFTLGLVAELLLTQILCIFSCSVKSQIFLCHHNKILSFYMFTFKYIMWCCA